MAVTLYPRSIVLSATLAFALWYAADVRIGVAALLMATAIDGLAFGSLFRWRASARSAS